LDEAAICLRRAADDSAKRLREWLSEEKLPPGKFFTLTENLREAKNRLLQGIPKRFYREPESVSSSQMSHISSIKSMAYM